MPKAACLITDHIAPIVTMPRRIARTLIKEKTPEDGVLMTSCAPPSCGGFIATADVDAAEPIGSQLVVLLCIVPSF